MSSKHFLITLLFVAFQVATGQDRGECIDDTQEHIQFLNSTGDVNMINNLKLSPKQWNSLLKNHGNL